jgi:hypothetical protein
MFYAENVKYSPDGSGIARIFCGNTANSRTIVVAKMNAVLLMLYNISVDHG